MQHKCSWWLGARRFGVDLGVFFFECMDFCILK